MLMFKIVGCGQLILLFALMGLSSASIISWVIAATFLLVFFLTCASISATRMQYDGLSAVFSTVSHCGSYPSPCCSSHSCPR